MDRDALLANIPDKPIAAPQGGQQQQRRRVVRRPQQRTSDNNNVPQHSVDIEALLNRVSEIFEGGNGTIINNDVSSLVNLENTVSEIIRQNSKVYGVRWDPEHLCSCQECDICRITVQKYVEHDHICVIVKGQRICEKSTDAKVHTGNVKKDDKNYYLCESTGNVHQCGDMCRSNKELTTNDNEYVCQISGVVLGVEMKGEWWTEKEKQEISGDSESTEIDQDAWEVSNPRYVIKRTYDANGNIHENVEYATKNITVTHHLHYHNHPFEKKYWYYLMRCKNILWLILYSDKRQQIERQRLLANYQNMEKSIDKYLRNCEKNAVLKSFHDMRAIVRYHMKPRTDIPIWIPPLRIMEPLLFDYARIIVKFFWIILEKTDFGRISHTQLPFDYFVLATINIMRTRGLVVNHCEILPQDDYLATHVPDPSLLHHFGIQLNFMTRTRNHINKAIGSIDPKLLRVFVTDMDATLFQDTRERRRKEHREQQEKQKREQPPAPPVIQKKTPSNKRKRK
jgi:hypothetical protein